MNKTHLSLAFDDVSGKSFTLRVDDPKANVDANSVETAAASIIASGAFRKGDKLKSLKKAEKVTVQTEVILEHKED